MRISKRCILLAVYHTLSYFITMFIILMVMGLIELYVANASPNFDEKILWASIGALGTNMGVISGFAVKKFFEKRGTLIAFCAGSILYFWGLSILFSGNTQVGTNLHIFFIFAFITHVGKGKRLRDIEDSSELITQEEEE